MIDVENDSLAGFWVGWEVRYAGKGRVEFNVSVRDVWLSAFPVK